MKICSLNQHLAFVIAAAQLSCISWFNVALLISDTEIASASIFIFIVTIAIMVGSFIFWLILANYVRGVHSFLGDLNTPINCLFHCLVMTGVSTFFIVTKENFVLNYGSWVVSLGSYVSVMLTISVASLSLRFRNHFDILEQDRTRSLSTM